MASKKKERTKKYEPKVTTDKSWIEVIKLSVTKKKPAPDKK